MLHHSTVPIPIPANHPAQPYLVGAVGYSFRSGKKVWVNMSGRIFRRPIDTSRWRRYFIVQGQTVTVVHYGVEHPIEFVPRLRRARRKAGRKK